MAAEGTAHAPTAGEYIIHHLQHLQNKKQTAVVDFSVINLDSLFFTVTLGVLGCWLLWLAARKATSGRAGSFPGRGRDAGRDGRQPGQGHRAQRQQPQARGAARADRVRLDLPAERDGPAAGRSDPGDLAAASGPALGCTGLHARRAHGRPVDHHGPVAGRAASCACTTTSRSRALAAGSTSCSLRPFGDKWFLYPINFLMQIIEFVAKTVSHGMRLFGNMYAGELIFMLIALMGGAWALSGTGIALCSRPHHRRHGLGHLPHPDHHAAGLRVHDADAGLHRPGARRALTRCLRFLRLLSAFLLSNLS